MANLPLYHFGAYRIFVKMELTKEEVCKHVGNKIREARENKGLTMEKFAHESGIDYTQISRIELGKINTSIYQIYVITKKLDLPLRDILHFENQ
jgi:ribosome-binding protein aMBF1 (putative translation factor)